MSAQTKSIVRTCSNTVLLGLLMAIIAIRLFA